MKHKYITSASAFLTFLWLVISIPCSSQGLNYEKGFNAYYNQFPKAIACNTNATYLVHRQYGFGFVSPSIVIKIDTNGNILWQNTVNPIFAEVTVVSHALATQDGGVIIAGNGRLGCDFVPPYSRYTFFQKLNTNGSIDWQVEWDSSNINYVISGLALGESGMAYLCKFAASSSIIYEISPLNGNILDSTIIYTAGLKDFAELSGYNFVTCNNDSVLAIDSAGNTLQIWTYSSFVQGIDSRNDSLFVLTSDSLFIYNNAMNLLAASNIASYNNLSHLKVSASSIRMLNKNANQITLLTVNSQFQILNSKIINDSTLPTSYYADYSITHMGIAIGFSLTMGRAVRLLDYSLNSAQNALVNSSDVSIADIKINQVSWSIVYFGVYRYSVDASVLVRNVGVNTVNSVRINRYLGPGPCSSAYYSENFINITVPPNDSVWIDLGYTGIRYLQPDTTIDGTPITFNYCVYTSHPNYLTDLNVTNDKYCETGILGFVGLEKNTLQILSIFPNPASSFIKIKLNTAILQENTRFYLYNLLGERILSLPITAKITAIPVQNINNGVYFAKIVAGGQSLATKKVVIQH